MEVRPNQTVDNSSQQQQQQRSQRNTAATTQKSPPPSTPNTVDSSSVSQRLQQELMSLMMSGGELGVSAFPEGESIFTWIGTIEGGKGTMYEGLSYKLSLRFPMDYPFKPPLVKFETTCFHPNVDRFDNICLDIRRTSGLQLMIAGLFFCPFKVYWESQTQRVPSTAMLLLSGVTRKITEKWSTNSTLLENHLSDALLWMTEMSCGHSFLWTPLDYLERDMSPMQSGCCKPPTACNYNMGTTVSHDQDCYRWNNAPNLLCYECDSCKAGVLEDIKRDWHKLSVLNIVMLVVLIGIYSIGCCAFQNTKSAETDYPYGQNRMSKVRPRWDYHWWRWWHHRSKKMGWDEIIQSFIFYFRVCMGIGGLKSLLFFACTSLF